MTFFVTCLFTLLYFIRPFEIISSLRGLPILFVAGIIAGVFLVFDVVSGNVKLFKNGTDQMMLGFYVAIGLSQLSHGYFSGALQSMQNFFPVFIGYFLVAHSINSERKLKIFFAILILSATFLAYEGLVQVRDGVSSFGVFPLEEGAGYSDEGTRITRTRIKWVGPFSDPNDLAMVFVLVVPLLLDYLLKHVVLIPLSLLGLITYGLYLTNSRGGILSLLAAVLTYAVLRYKSVKGLVIGLCLGGLLLILGPSRIGDISASEDSAYGRLEAWYSGYQMFKSSPVFGVGHGMFTDFHRLTAHNSFVQVFAELGLFGLLFFVGLFYFPIMNGYKTIFSNGQSTLDQDLTNTYNSVLSGLVGIMVSMFFLSRSYQMLPYMVSALLISFVNPAKQNYGFVNVLAVGMKQCVMKMLSIAIIGIIFVNLMIKILL